MTPQPMIVVHDVPATSDWYQRTLGLRGGHGGDEYEQLFAGQQLVLQLHRWEADEHPHLGDPAHRPYGNGVLLWFHTPEVDATYARAQAAGAEVLQPLALNPNAQHREFWLKDPNGYVVVVAGNYGDI